MNVCTAICYIYATYAMAVIVFDCHLPQYESFSALFLLPLALHFSIYKEKDYRMKLFVKTILCRVRKREKSQSENLLN